MKFLTLYNKSHLLSSSNVRRTYILLFSLTIILITAISCSQSEEETQNNSSQNLRMTFAVTDFSIGDNRIAFAILDPQTGVIFPKSLEVSTYYLDSENPNDKIQTLETQLRQWPNGKGVYTAEAEFSETGKWGIGINLFYNDEYHKIATSIIVPEKSQTPFIGSKAPIVETKTSTSIDTVSNITSALEPYMPLYKTSLKESLESQMPTVILFATPAFCKTGTCGPQLDVIKDLSNEWSNKLNFIHSEIYSNPNEIKGDLSNAKISEAAKEWNLPSEPWTFVINESGVIISKFEGFATKEEIEESIKTILN